MHHGYWNDGWANSWGWIPMALMMILFWGGVVWLAITLLRRTTPTHIHSNAVPPAPPPAPEPAQILAERLARGDIDVDEYRRRLDALRPPSSPG